MLDRYMTAKFPLMVILIEMAERLTAVNVGPALRWVPRLQNEEADAFTNGCFSEFTAGLRIEAKVCEMPFLARKDLMGKVGTLMAEIATLKTIGPMSGPTSANRMRLRETDPWGSVPLGLRKRRGYYLWGGCAGAACPAVGCMHASFPLGFLLVWVSQGR